MPGETSGIAITDVATVLHRHFDSPVTDLRVQGGGNVAQVFRFTANGGDHVVRFAAPAFAAFEQEAFIATHYASPDVPISRIVGTGQVGDLSYAISVAAEGVHLDSLPPAGAAAIVPQLFDVLDAIHAADTSATTGWGWIGPDGNGMSPSWRQHISGIVDPDHHHPYYGTWQSVFDTTALDPPDVEPLGRTLTDLLPACPEHRTLLHGDFGFTNVLVADGRITAVLDWANALYGDALYDLAWLDFWGEGKDYAETGDRRAADRGDDQTGFAERLACYQAYIALDALRFFAKRDEASGVEWVRNRVQSLGLDRGT